LSHSPITPALLKKKSTAPKRRCTTSQSHERQG
jgi:hypothetical protein